MNKILRTLLLLAVILSLCALFTSCDDGEVTSVGLKFELNEDGESYTVVGMGICTDRHVIIDTYKKKPITAIADMAFNSNDDITAITLGSSVREVGKYAFSSCDNLTAVNLSEGVEVLHPNAFYGCDKLESITLPDSLKRIDSYAFEYCTALREIEFGKSLESIGEFAFYGCYSLESVSFGDKLNVIGRSAFSNCNSLKSASFGSSMNVISKDAFAGCLNLEQLNFVPAPINIGESAFRLCTSLRTLTLPSGTIGIGHGAFSKCDSLENIDFGPSIRVIASEAFFACRNIKELYLPDSLTSISGYAFQECTGLESISLPFIGMKASDTSGAHLGNIFGSTNESLVPDTLKHVTVRAKTIPSGAFRNCANVETITVGSGVSTVSSNAFTNCTGLKRVEFKNGVKTIGSSIFSGCEALEEVSFSSTITSVGTSVFTDCVNIKRVNAETLASWCKISFSNANANPMYLGAELYIDGAVLSDVLVVPEDAKQIGSFAFCGSKIRQVILHDDVTSVSSTAFDSCENLSMAEYDGAYYLGTEENPYFVLLRAKTSDAISIKVHSDAKIISREAFYNCMSLNSVSLPDGLTTICAYAFRSCERLEGITIPESVTTIGYQAFVGCSALRRVVLESVAVWQINDSEDGLVELLADALSDPTTACEMLCVDYLSYTWSRKDPK